MGRDADRVKAYENVSSAWHGDDANRIGELLNIGEDCLYLNVWTPDHAGDQKLPVMVWIHGGSNRSGWSHQHYYDGENLADRGAVVITINYRLGVFGFFSHPALSAESEHGVSGNYAILDQIAALKWVQKYASKFGGDPGNVTIFGESAGGTNVSTLLASPLAKGLFNRAIIQSTGFSALRSSTEDEAIGTQIAASIDIVADPASAAALAELRARGPDEILRASNESREGAWYGPAVDGWVLPSPSLQAYETGLAKDVTVMIGVNRDEASLFIPGPVSEDRLQKTIATITNDVQREQRLGAILSDEPDVFKRLVRLVTGSMMLCSSKQAAIALSGHQADVYFYYFTRERPDSQYWLGAHHAAEIPYIFGTGRDVLPWPEIDLALSDNMARYWLDFARTGNPNVGDLPRWPRLSAESLQYMDLGDTARARADVEADLCAEISQQ
jgi:para-nitrobenzyl esterase